MEKIKFKAQIKPYKSKIAIILIVIALIIDCAISSVVEVKLFGKEHNIFGDYVYYSDGISLGFSSIMHIGDWIMIGLTPLSSSMFYIECLCLIAAICIIFGSIRTSIVSGRCSLVLKETGIIGRKVGLFSVKELKLPMDKIDSITVQRGILDKIYGGQTVAIRSASGLIKFAWIQNAQEFVDKTLAEIQKYNETIELKNNVSVNSEAEKLQKLKILLEQGLITQEEYDTKRKEMINNM